MGFSFTPTTYVYMLVNKKVTLARFGRILSETEWTRFREFMNTCIREKRQINKQNKEEIGTFFVQAPGSSRVQVSLRNLNKHLLAVCQVTSGEPAKSC